MYHTSLASSELMMWRTLEDYGLDPEAIFIEAGLDPDQLHESGSRYPARASYRLWKLARAATNDPCLGLKVASFWHPSAAHALGFAWLASDNLEQAFGRLLRYYRVLNDIERLSLDELGDSMRLTLHKLKPLLATDEMYDTLFATIILLSRFSSAKPFNPLRVSLRRAAPRRKRDFTEFFGAPVTFDADEDALYFSKALLREPLPTANVEMAHASDRIVTRYLARLDRSHMAMQVKAELIDLLPSGNVTQQDVAKALNVSLRTLQRRLADEGTSYTAVLDETRRELATQYIKRSHMPINQIGFLLGFSEPSNFSRAFRRWTGRAPGGYREADRV